LHIEGTRPQDTQVLPARGQRISRSKALDKSKAALVRRMHASGESASTIATTLVSVERPYTAHSQNRFSQDSWEQEPTPCLPWVAGDLSGATQAGIGDQRNTA